MLATGGAPIGGAAAAGGAPIASLGGVFSGGFPLGGIVGQLFRSGGPVPNFLFLSLLTSAGPIDGLFVGLGGAPIGALAIPFDDDVFSSRLDRQNCPVRVCVTCK